MGFAASLKCCIVAGLACAIAARPMPTNATHDMDKCNAGRREFCPPIVRCWLGVEEVPCGGEHSYPTMNSYFLYEPPRELNPDEPFWCGWQVDFKNSSEGGLLPDPWVSHTNIHIAPADVGSLAPPTQHPLRKDSQSLTGPAGEFWSNLSLPSGLWLIMAHVRVKDMNDPASPQYEMTLDIVRRIGTEEDQTEQDGDEDEGKVVETFCKVGGWHLFDDCDDFRKAWIGLVSGITGLFLLLWIQTFFFVDHMASGGLSLRLEGKRISFLRVLVSFGLLGAIITTNNKFLFRWLHTNRTPARITTKTNEPLRFSNVLLCPFTTTGRLQVLSAVHYPNLYGLSAHQVRTQEAFEVNLVDDKDGTEIRRSCTKLDLKQHHDNVKLNVTSEFTTLMVKTIVLDPVRTETEGFGDAMAVLYDKESDLQDVKKFTVNLILVGQSAATFTSLSPRVFVDIEGNRTSSFLFTTNAIANPYLRNRNDACKTATSDGLCEHEAVLVVNWRTLETEMIVEETTLDILTVITLMVGIVSGCRMALELSTNLLMHWWHDYLDEQVAFYFVGHAETDEGVDAESGEPVRSASVCSVQSLQSTGKKKRASVTEIYKAVRHRKSTTSAAKEAQVNPASPLAPPSPASVSSPTKTARRSLPADGEVHVALPDPSHLAPPDDSAAQPASLGNSASRELMEADSVGFGPGVPARVDQAAVPDVDPAGPGDNKVWAWSGSNKVQPI